MSKLNTGWLSPTGEFVKTEYMEHIAVATKICSHYKDFNFYNDDPESFLENRGWIGIHLSLWGKREWSIGLNLSIPMSSEQRMFLKQYLDDDIDASLIFRDIMENF